MVPRRTDGKIRVARPYRAARRRALDESNERYRSLFTYNPHAAFSIDPQGLFIDANPVAQQVSGYSLEEFQTMIFTDVVCPEDRPRVVAAFQGALLRVPQRLEASMFHRDGHLIEMNLTAVPVVVADEVVGVHGIAEDITERNQLRRELERARELAEQANTTKSLFLANMSHEVRTPLTSLLGSVEMLRETELDAEQTVLATLLDRSGERLLRLVSDLLDFSRIEAGTLVVLDEAVDLGKIIDEALRGVAPLAVSKGVALHTHIDPDLPERIHGDAIRISQVLFNLLENAVKFTEKGEVRLGADVAEGAPGGVWVRFRVEDTGIGIAKQQLFTLFEAFTQADPSDTRKYGGAGLGLAICRELVALMHGTLTVESTEHVGSTFVATIPFTAPVDP